ncbi:head-tail connector protein [Tropicimonas marinistellae]|uniref:head-tail connector protein n=1 Tax=Tropicimonas marinistellae TaxID=1739787 RepID=UPI00083546EB|nr:head-tail connector protein [Tropicimonas marinistellae]
MKPIRVTPPATRPVSLEEFKEHVRVDHSDDDTIMQAYLDAAVSKLDGHAGILGRCLINQEWKVSRTAWASMIRLPFPDVSEVAVTYDDPDGVEQTVASGLYEVIEADLGSMIWFGPDFTEPSLADDVAEPVTVTFTAGYGDDADDVPWALRVAVMQLAATWYCQRESVGEGTVVPLATEALIGPYRRICL